MTELAMILFVAAIGHGLSRATGIPVIPLLLALGMLVSFSGLVPHGADGVAPGERALFVLELGLIMLVFASGIELNPQRFRRQRKSVVLVGLVQFTVMGFVGYLGARLFGFERLEAVYLGFAVSASSTLVVLRQLQVSQQSFESHGRMVVGVLLLQDALTIATLVALSHFSGGPAWVAEGFGWMALLAATAWGLQRWGARWVIVRCGGDEESMLLAVLTVLFVFLGAAHYADLPLVAGAFLAGYSLSSFPVSGLVGGLLQSLTDFFRAIFFVTLGSLVVMPGAAYVGSAIGLALLVLVVTPPLVALLAEKCGFTRRTSLESGLLLAQTSEYSLVIGWIGLQMGHLRPEIFAVIALMSVLTMTTTPFLARDRVARRLMTWLPRRRNPAGQAPGESGASPSGHALILGLGSAGMWTLRPLQQADVPVLVVDDDPVVIEELREKGIACIRGDGGDEKLLQRAGAAEARLVVASMRRIADAEKVLSHVRDVPVLVRVFEDSDARRIHELGGIPVSTSEAAAEEFFKWFQKRFPHPDA